MLTKGAIGNLINRYRSVLKKCHLINTFGSLAVASMLVLGGAGVAEAEDYSSFWENKPEGINASSNVENANNSTDRYLKNSSKYAVMVKGATEQINKANVWIEGKASGVNVNSTGTGINEGNIYIISGGKDITKGFMVNRGGTGINKGLIYVKSGAGMYDQRDGKPVTMRNDSAGTIVTDGSGAYGIVYNGWNGSDICNKGLIVALNKGTGVYISNEFTDAGANTEYEFDASINGIEKEFKNEGTIIIDANKDNQSSTKGIQSKSYKTQIFNKGTILVNDEYGIGIYIENNTFDTRKRPKIEDSNQIVINEKDAQIKGVGTLIKVDGKNDTLINLGHIGTTEQQGYIDASKATNFTLQFEDGSKVNALFNLKNDTQIIVKNLTNTDQELNLAQGEIASLSVTNSTFAAKGDASGALTITDKLTLEDNAKVTAQKLTVKEGSITKSKLDVANLTLETNAGTLNIVESAVTIDTLTASGGTIDVDPSTVIIKNLAGGELGSALRVRDSSAVVIGGDSIDGAVPGTSEHTAGKAALVLGKPITLSGTGGILVDPQAASGTAVDAGSAIFADGSLLAVKASDAAKGAVITGNRFGKLEAKGQATLYIADAATNQTYRIAEKFTEANVADTAWSQEHGTLIINSLLDVELNQNKLEDGSVEFVTRTKLNDDSAFFDAIPSNALHELADAGLEADADNAGKKFLSRAAESTVVGYTSSVDEGVAMVNEVSRVAVTAGVQNTSLRIADAASNTVVDHMSLAQHDGSKAIHSDGVDFWAAPMYGNLYTSGMVVSGSSVRGQFGGLALGADLEAGKFLGGKFRLGAAINGGGGKSETKGDITSTQNDYDFGGLSLYAGWQKGGFNLIGSLGYGFGNHEVDMALPSTLAMGNASADIDTTLFTADLRAEYQLSAGWLDIMPHAGVRYTALKTGEHELSVPGGVVNTTESDTQHIVQFPMGVALSADVACADWNLKPMADFSVIPAAGEKKAFSRMRFTGVDAVDSVNSRIMDSTSYAATLGLMAEKGQLSLGLSYGVQASSNETDQNIQVKFGWKF